LERRGSLSICFDPEMVWTPPPSGKRGRQQQFSDTAIQTCLTLKRPVWYAPMLPSLLNQISPDQDIGSATADGANDTRKCHEAIAA
jgi:hypothetical protein